MSIKKIIVFSLLLGTLQACSSSDSDYDYDGPCSLDFAVIPVQVQDVAGQPIALDSIKVYRGEEDITLIEDFESEQFGEMQKAGSYVIVTDNMKKSLLNQKVDIKFTGYIGKHIVAEKIIQVSADDCHVFNLTEDLKVIVKEPR